MDLTVIQILPALEAGGVERGTLEVARYLVQCGHRSIVLSAGGRLVPELTNAGSVHVQLPIGGKSLLTLRLLPRLRSIFSGADIVHARSRFPAWLAWLAWRGMHAQTRPGFITTVHGVYSVNAYSRIMTRGERVIAVSDYIRDYILTNYQQTEPGRIITIHRGIDPHQHHPDYRPDAGWLRNLHEQFPELRDKFLLTLPGRITRRKGHEDFLQLLAGLPDRQPGIHGLIVGGPQQGKQGYFAALQAKAAAMGLARRITFTGHRDDLREILSISGIALSLSRLPEAFGRTVLEALALGTPVIAYAHGGVREIMQTLFPGGQVQPGDIDGSIALVEKFFHERPAIPAHHPYLLQTMLNLTIACYEDLAQGRR